LLLCEDTEAMLDRLVQAGLNAGIPEDGKPPKDGKAPKEQIRACTEPPG
jgi:hypothetical protein